MYFSLRNSTIHFPIFSVQRWLERTPGLNEEGFNFPQKFKEAVEAIFDKEWQRVQVISKMPVKLFQILYIAKILYLSDFFYYQFLKVLAMMSIPHKISLDPWESRNRRTVI